MSTTRSDLIRRLAALLVAAVAGTVVLAAAFHQVHRNSDPLRTSSAPAVIGVDAAERALGQAQQAAQNGVGANGEDFTTEISVAQQSLAQAAASNVTGDSGRLALKTVAGQLASYTDWIQQAELDSGLSALHKADLHYADSLLNDPDNGGIIPKLRELQRQQQAVVARQATFGWAGRLLWGAALLVLAALAGLLAESQRYLFRRFRRRLNPGLVAASVLLAALVAVPVVLTVQTEHALDRGRADLHRTNRQAQSEVGEDMRDTHGRATAGYWTIGGAGTALAVLVAAGMGRRIGDYRFQPR